MQVRTIIAVVFCTVLAIALLAYYGTKKELVQERKDHAATQVLNGGLVVTVEQQAQSAGITEATHVAVAEQAKTIVTQQDAIARKVKEQVAQINQATPASTDPVLEKTRQDRISATRIDGVWEAFCTGMPAAVGCVAKP